MATNLDQMKTSTASKLEIAILLFTLLMAPGAYLINVPAVNNYLGFERNQTNDIQINGDPSSTFDGNYTEHAPIFINGNSGFAALGFNGSGTIDDSYVIEGLNITSSSGTLIAISNTNVHFVIRNNILNGLSFADGGIILSNVTYSTISNNLVTDNIGPGVSIDNSLNIQIRNNSILANMNNGLSLGNVKDSIVVNNSIQDNLFGIALGGDNISIIENNIANSQFDGIISEFDSCTGCLISRNTIVENKGSGIAVYSRWEQVIISYNTIRDNNGQGIFLTNSLFDSIRSNNISNNGDGGVQLVDSNNNVVANNIIYGGGIFLAGTDNIISNNTITGKNSRTGVGLEGSNNRIVGNDIRDFQNGFDVKSQNNLIENNEIHHNSMIAVWLNAEGTSRSNNNTISSNLIYENGNLLAGFAAVTIEGANDNTVIENDFRSNIGHVEGGGSNNLVLSNYYDDWSGVGPYSIPGSADIKDLEPQFNPNHMSSLSLIIDDGVSLALEGDISISWNSVSDTFDHAVTYSIHYSTNDGLAWIGLETGLTLLNYILDTTIIVDGTNVIFKVEAMDEVGFVRQTITDDTYQIVNSLHTLSLTVSNPNGVQSGTISLSWDKIDSWGHELLYDVYYSLDDGSTWNLLTNDLAATSFDWDTTLVENGNYLIKVVANDVDGSSIEAFSLSFVIENMISMTAASSENRSNDAPINLNTSGLFFAAIVLGVLNLNRKKHKDSTRL